MIYEVAEIEIKPGAEADFEAAVTQAAPHFKSAKGCRSLALQRGVEQPSIYRLIVGWDTVEDHMVTFRESDGFQAWRTLASPHFAAPPKVVHMSKVLTAF
jgi:heme-degrading monooxygenase HmoA